MFHFISFHRKISFYHIIEKVSHANKYFVWHFLVVYWILRNTLIEIFSKTNLFQFETPTIFRRVLDKFGDKFTTFFLLSNYIMITLSNRYQITSNFLISIFYSKIVKKNCWKLKQSHAKMFTTDQNFMLHHPPPIPPSNIPRY